MNKKLLLEEFEYIKARKRISVFWITQTDARAARIDHLIETGAIIRKDGDDFPWCIYDVDESKL